MSTKAEQILERGNVKEIRSLFAFDRSNTDEEVRIKFNLWARYLHPGYFMDERKEKAIPDAPFHKEIDLNNIRTYRGTDPEPDGKSVFPDSAFRGAAKTSRTKLFFGFVIGNDADHYRKFMKIASEDPNNSVQSVTDIYNMYVSKAAKHFYPEVFQKTPEKRIERMGNFETMQNVKLLATTVGIKQRGHVQDEYRPDFIWFDDFESRVTLRSAAILQKIWDNMQEAYDGLSRDGGAIYTCNYLSERGNVHKVIQKYRSRALVVPIKGEVILNESGGVLDAMFVDGPPTWSAAYTPRQVEAILEKAEDPAGEYLSCPSEGQDIYFDRKSLDKQERKQPVDIIAGFKIFHPYEDPGHVFSSGHDVGGGVGLDHSTSVFINHSTVPAKVVATFKSNTLKPIQFGAEVYNESKMFGFPLCAPENNKFDSAIAELIHKNHPNIYVMREKPTRAGVPGKVRQWGWNTNSASKERMISKLAKAVKDGHLELSDPDLISEARAYTRDDLLDREEDPRLSTRHFDLLIAAAIAWDIRGEALVNYANSDTDYEQQDYQPSSEFEVQHTPQGITIPVRPPSARSDDYQQQPYVGESEYEH